MVDPSRSGSMLEQLQTSLGSAYTLERELGGGGMSRVFTAIETSLGRTVVLKVLPAEMAGQLSIDRFRREIMLAARLQHPHIVPLLNAGEIGGLPFFTMPFIEGESLRVRIARHGELPINDAVRVLREVASALAYAHEHGVVHRDVKPDNVLIAGGSAMVSDFGVAKALSASSDAREGNATSIGVALGTPAYMAPEQAAADPAIDQRADIYAFGVLSYEILSGQPPFTGRSPQSLLAAQINEVPEPIAKRRPNLPPALGALVMRCLEKRAADRPQSASDIVHALDNIATPSGGLTPWIQLAPTERVASLPLPKRRAVPWKWISAAAVVGITATAGAYAVRAKPTAPTTIAVFPFENTGGDTSMAYFADGITDELATALSDAGQRVIGRASVLAVQSKHLTDQEAGRALNAGMILHGRVARSGTRLRVWTQLVNASDGSAIATKTYDTTMTNVFGVQDELARAITAALRLNVAPTLTARSSRGTDDLRAYEAYMKGRFHDDRFQSVPAIAAYRLAIERDPRFARAMAGLSLAYTRLALEGSAAADSAYDRAREFASRALTIDSLLPFALVAEGLVLANEFRFDSSLAVLKRAADLAPDKPEILVEYGGMLESAGRIDDALALHRRALTLDPLSVSALINLQYDEYLAGDYSAALEYVHRALELDSTSTVSWVNLSLLLQLHGKPDSAVAAARRAFSLGRYGSAEGLVVVYAFAGKWPEARALRDQIRKQSGNNSPNFSRAFTDVPFAEWDDAMMALEKAFEAREPTINSLSVSCDPIFDYLKSNPRFGTLMARYGLRVCPAKGAFPVPKPPR